MHVILSGWETSLYQIKTTSIFFHSFFQLDLKNTYLCFRLLLYFFLKDIGSNLFCRWDASNLVFIVNGYITCLKVFTRL